MTEDMRSLREFARHGSEEAFASVVSRHINLVYSVALRQVRDRHLAEEIAQTVFLILAKKARGLDPDTILSGWLCRTTRNASSNALTVQRRRRDREQKFMESQLNETEPDPWTQIQPLLEDAMGKLARKDHDALVLRFFEGRNFKELSATLGTSEAAAKMRVNRALEKLRKLFLKQGVKLSVTAIAGAVSSQSLQAAPIGLGAAVAATAVKGSQLSVSTLTLLKTTFKIMAWTKFRSAVLCGAALLLAGGATLVIHGVESSTNTNKVTTANGTFTFAGYANPEAAYQSLLWALNSGDLVKVQAALTPDQAERFRQRLAGKSDDEIKRLLIESASWMVAYQITEKEVRGPDEVLLHLLVQPHPGHPNVGNDVQVMQKIGKDWKYAGKFGVDIQIK